MKKVLSLILGMCMLVSVAAFAASAETAVPEIKDGAVIEFENYGGEENKDMFVFTSDTEGLPNKPYGVTVMSDYVTEGGASLSGGGLLSLTERRGATGMTFTIPVTVSEPGWYHMEVLGTNGGESGEYTSRYTVALGDSSLNVAGNGTTVFKPPAGTVQGDSTDIYYYPVCSTTGRIYVAESVQNVVITATPNTNGTSSGTGIKMVLDALRFTKEKAVAKVVDNNRTRLEFGASVSVEPEESYSVDFTVPVDGNYAFMLNKNKNYYGYISASVKSGETEIWSVSNVSWDGANSGANKTYARLGKGTTGTVALKKDTPYVLTFTPTAMTIPSGKSYTNTLTTSYVDVLCTDIVADGKKLIQPYFYKTCGMNSDHFLNNADTQNDVASYINENLSDYTVVGKPETGELTTPWAIAELTPLPSRTDHIEYNIVAPKSGKYIFKVAGKQYMSDTPPSPRRETVYFQVDGVQVATDVYAAPSYEEGLYVMSAVLDLTEGSHVVRFQRNNSISASQEGGTHTYMRIGFVTIEPKATSVIDASEDFVRIEMAGTVVLKPGETGTFEFTVPEDGNYAFMAGSPNEYNQYYGNAKAVLTNEDTGEETVICESIAWTGTASGSKIYRRLGNGSSGTVALSAGTNYSVSVTPIAASSLPSGKQADLGLSHIDVLNTDITVSGSTVIPTQYYEKASQTNEHFLNNADYAGEGNTYISSNFPTHKRIGALKNGVVLTTNYRPNAVTTILGGTNYVTYKLNVEKAGNYRIATRASVHSGSSVAYPDTVYFDVDGDVSGGAYNPPSYAAREQSIEVVKYLSAGEHTLKIYRNNTSSPRNDVMYLMFVALTELQPTAKMYAGSVSDENEIFAVQDGTLVAQIDTEGTIAQGEEVNAFFAIYDNTKQMVAVDAYNGALDSEEITLTIPNFKKTAGKTYKAKAFLWNENFWGDVFVLAEGMDELIDFVVSVPEGRDAVVLQISDTQIIDSSQVRTADRLGADLAAYTAPDQVENRLDKYVRETVAATNPDLILLAGDIVYGEFDDKGTSFTHVVELMESFGIPWAPVFGNHEGESKKGFDWQCAQLENAENCLFKQRNLSGNGNYTVGIEQGGEMKRVFFMMDSNGCGGASAESKANGHTVTTQGFAPDQVEWFEKVGNQIQAQVPGIKVSFCFHIQMAKFAEANAKYGFVQGDKSTYNIDIDTHPDKADTDFGYIGGNIPSSWDVDGTIYNKMKAIGMDSLFIGHQHAVNSSVMYDGVRFQYGMKSSVYDAINYRKDDGTIANSYTDVGFPLVGGTVMNVAEDDGALVDCYIYTCKNEY